MKKAQKMFFKLEVDGEWRLCRRAVCKFRKPLWKDEILSGGLENAIRAVDNLLFVERAENGCKRIFKFQINSCDILRISIRYI